MQNQILYKRNLYVSFLRVVALLCILMHHSMIMYIGWPPFDWGDCVLHQSIWEDMLSNSLKTFGLGMFTFLSGYLLYNQRKKNQNYLCFVWGKVKRLVFPCLCFALLYYFVFPHMMERGGPINGTHLWYVPMIFICIIVTSISVYCPKLWWITLGVFFVLLKFRTYISYRPIFEFIRYFPIFYIGYIGHLCRDSKCFFSFKPCSYKIVSWCVILGLIFFVFQFANIVHHTTNIFTLCGNAFSIGLLLFIILLLVQTLRTPHTQSWGGQFAKLMLQSIDQNSFAIYLLHQFIINLCLLTMHRFLATIPTILGSCIVCTICLFGSLGIALSYDKCMNYIKTFKSK